MQNLAIHSEGKKHHLQTLKKLFDKKINEIKSDKKLTDTQKTKNIQVLKSKFRNDKTQSEQNLY